MKRGYLILGAVILGALLLLFLSRRGTEPAEPAEPQDPAKTIAAPVTKPDRGAPLTAHRPSLYVAPASAGASAKAGEMSFSGRVISRASSAGNAGIAEAELTFSRAEASQSILTKSDGTFEFTPTEPGTYQLAAVTANGFLPFAPAWGESPLELTARPGRRITDLVIYLEPEKIILGKVIDPNAAPVANASVTLLVPAEEHMTLVALDAEYTTDAQGQFRFRAPVGALVEVQHPSFDLAQERFTTKAHDKGEMTIQLRPKSAPVDRLSISGTVVDDAGAGLPNALVTAAWGDHNGWQARSDAEGAFELRGLRPGEFTLVASSPGLISARAEAVAAGTKDVLLRLHAEGGFISGRVTSSSSKGGVPSFAVVLSKPVGRLEQRAVGTRSFLDPEGRFSMGPLEAATYLVRVIAHGYAATEPQSVEVVVGKTSEASFDLSRGATLIGVVVNGESSEPIAGARVELEGLAIAEELPIEVESIVTSGADGSFTMSGIAAGLRAIAVQAKGYDTRILSGLEIAEGATVGPVEARLTPLATPDAEPKRELTGIGAALSAEGDLLLIGQVLEGGGASEAGLVPGDRIVAIDEHPLTEMDMNGAIQRIRGPEGTSVLLTVRRSSGGEEKIAVTRRKIRA